MFTYINRRSFIFGGENYNPSMFAVMTVTQKESTVYLEAILPNGEFITATDHFDSIEEARIVTEAVRLACTNSGGMERRIYETISEGAIIPKSTDGFTYCLNTVKEWRNSQLEKLKSEVLFEGKTKVFNQPNEEEIF